MNTPLYSNTVICTLAVDGWAIFRYTWYSEEGPGRAVAPLSPFIVVPINSPPINQRPVYQLHIIQCGTVITFAL